MKSKVFALLFFLMFQSKLLSDVFEKWIPEKAKVGDIVTFELELSEKEKPSLKFPKVGFYPETELPKIEILSINDFENKFQFQARFLESGEFTFPAEWIDENGEVQKANQKIKVESNLTGSEFDIYDITEPIEFDGPYLLRLLGWILGILLVLATLSYFLLKMKRIPKPKLDAKFQTVENVAQRFSSKENPLLKILEQEEIPHKEFAYLLSFEVKDFLYKKYKIDLESFTNKELLRFIQEKTKLSDLERMRMENYLDMIKYMPNEEKISKELAKKIYKNWMDILQK